MTKVLYTGSFDPITKGHENIIKQASELFDEVIVAILKNPKKPNGFFTIEERLEILKKIYSTCENIKIITSSSAAVDVATLHKCKAIVRGLRGLTDFDYEIGMAGINKDISDGQINTVCLFADNNYQNISSSMVKEVFSLGKPISKYVSPIVENAMNEKYLIEETSAGRILTLRRKEN
jgi:pantetheine-phosphate adenylyltransferase